MLQSMRSQSQTALSVLATEQQQHVPLDRKLWWADTEEVETPNRESTCAEGENLLPFFFLATQETVSVSLLVVGAES